MVEERDTDVDTEIRNRYLCFLCGIISDIYLVTVEGYLCVVTGIECCERLFIQEEEKRYRWSMEEI